MFKLQNPQLSDVLIEKECREDVDEKAYIAACNNADFQLPIGKDVLAVVLKYFRPTEVDLLIGDPTKVKPFTRFET